MRAPSVFSEVLCLTFLLASTNVFAQQPEPVLQMGHSGAIETVTFSFDGGILASGGEDSTIKLWDVSRGIELRSITGHKSKINSLAFSPDGRTLASGDKDATVKLWSVNTGTELRTFRQHKGAVIAITFSPNGSTLITGSVDGTVRFSSVVNGQENEPPVEIPSSTLISLSPNGAMLAVSGIDQTIRLWDLVRHRELHALPGKQTLPIRSLAFSSDGKLLASGSDDKTIRLWDISKGTLLRSIGGLSERIWSLTFNADATKLASASDDRTIKLWDVSRGQELQTIETEPVKAVAFNRDGGILATGGENLKLLDLISTKDSRVLVGSTSDSIAKTFRSFPVLSIAFSPNGRFLASGNPEYRIKLWDIASGREMRVLMSNFGFINPLIFSPDSKMLAARTNGAISLWDASVGFDHRVGVYGMMPRTIVADSESSELESFAFSPDSRTIACGFENGKIQLLDVATGTLIRTLEGHLGKVMSVSFNQKGTILASGSADQSIILWDVATGRKLRSMTTGAPVRSLLFSPKAEILASTGSEHQGVTKLWDAATGKHLRMVGLSAELSPLAFSPDGKMLASGDQDKAPRNDVRLSSVDTGLTLCTLTGHSGVVTSVDFHPDGKIVASADIDGQIKLWDVATCKELATLVALSDYGANAREWIVTTPEGFFDGSPTAWTSVFWRFSPDLFDLLPAEAFFNELYQPDLLRSIVSGARPKLDQTVARKDRRQPKLSLRIMNEPLPGNKSRAEKSVTVQIEAIEAPKDKDHAAGCGVRDVRLFRNGSLVRLWSGEQTLHDGKITLEATISLSREATSLTAYAFNHYNIKSPDAELFLEENSTSLDLQGTTYVLAVGINRYADPRINLKYAVADSNTFAQVLKGKEVGAGELSRSVESILLTNEQATKVNIMQALSQLAGDRMPASFKRKSLARQLQRFKKSTSNDLVFIYFSGHGKAIGDRFYLIPHDIKQTSLDAGLPDPSISDRDLEGVFARIEARLIVMVIDTCNAGQVLEAKGWRPGPLNSKGLAQLAYEKGMYILAAAQGYQAAWEISELGHGLLTYALIEEGLRQGRADEEPADGFIDLKEWLDYTIDRVPQLQLGKMRQLCRDPRRLCPAVVDGEDKKALEKRSVQRPRIYYRRESGVEPLIIARTVLQ